MTGREAGHPYQLWTEEIARTKDRADLIAWLQWCDRNGRFSDEDSELEGIAPLTHADALSLVLQILEDSK